MRRIDIMQNLPIIMHTRFITAQAVLRIFRKQPGLAVCNTNHHFTVFEFKGIVAEKLASPAFQGFDVRLVVGGDLLKVTDCGDQFLRHIMFLATDFERDFKQLDCGTKSIGQSVLVAYFGQRIKMSLQP